MEQNKKDKRVERTVVRLNLGGPITILGCAAQGCNELILEGTAIDKNVRVEEQKSVDPHH
jgi:hypothetical protein